MNCPKCKNPALEVKPCSFLCPGCETAFETMQRQSFPAEMGRISVYEDDRIEWYKAASEARK